MIMENATKLLGLENFDEFDEFDVFKSFAEKFTNGGEKERRALIEAKIHLNIFLEEKRRKEGSSFTIPLKNFCKRCGSKGYFPYREKILKTNTCKYCQGTGVKTVHCKKCTGTGRINGEVCSTCKGSGKYHLFKKNIPCKYCKGTAERDEVVDGKIIDIQICKSCRGAGFNTEFPPILSKTNLNDTISEQLQSSRPPEFKKLANALSAALDQSPEPVVVKKE
jgi:DnaJ-class molecular chaperone